MMRVVWQIVGMGVASAVALGCGGDAEQDEHGAAESGGTEGSVTGGASGTGATSAAEASGGRGASGGSTAGGAGGRGGVTGDTGGNVTGGTSGAGGADGGTGGIPTGGASGGGGHAGGAGGAGGGGGADGGASGGVTGGASGGGGVAGGNGGVVSSGGVGGGGATGEAGAGGSSGMITACSEPTEAVRMFQQGWWLCGWSGGLDHYSWMYFGTGNQMGTLVILDATCTACMSYFGCAGTDGEYSAAASKYWVALAMPSGCAETDWTIWEVSAVCPPDGYPAGSSAYVTLTDGTTSLRCDRYPLDQCDATLSSCPMPR
ncbi:MAG: hypothetical protein JW751_03440 [Polyangiaceae bacterium]|nr:hypothetical protein [Polyangiaceae bacterium]